MHPEFHNIDAMVGLSRIPDNSIDMIFTDPPYPVISGGSGTAGDGSPTGILAKNDGKIFEHNNIDITDYAAELYRVLTDPGHCYVMTNFMNLWRFQEVLTGVGFQIHNLLVWHKTNTVANRWFMKNAEYILFLRKGKARGIYTPGAQTVIRMKGVPSKERTHPTEKPVNLIREYIRASSLPFQTVLDPFAGTASAGVASIAEGRRFVGFEVDPAYHLSGNLRLSRASHRPNPQIHGGS